MRRSCCSFQAEPQSDKEWKKQEKKLIRGLAPAKLLEEFQHAVESKLDHESPDWTWRRFALRAEVLRRLKLAPPSV
ncbi:hypothetical protein EPN90_02430 [Patescibacteria group bacterium]|nr:MAG: hypothetical protein EPN90_02430 [Patescibacteria group bacterium]